MDLPAPLTQKLGPLPVWGWGLGLGGGVAIGLYIRHRRAMAAVPAQDSTTQPDAGATTSSLYQGDYLPASPGLGAYGGGPSYAGSTSDDLIGAVVAGIGQYVSANPIEPAVQQPAGAAPPPVSVIVSPSAPPEVRGGGGPPVARPRTTQQAPAPAPIPRAPGDPNRADTGVTHRGVDEGTLNAAMSLTGRRGFPRVERSTMADRMRAHPDWGPYTLAHNGKLDGHSVAF